jgi:hypothetical protein
MPASMHPFTFVEIQTRYLVAVLVPLTVLTGAWIGDMSRAMAQSTRPRLVGACLLFAALMYAGFVPSQWWDRYGVQQAMGIREATAQCAAAGGSELMLSNQWKTTYPLEISAPGIALAYDDFADPTIAERIVHWLRQASPRCVLLLRVPYRSLSGALQSDGADLVDRQYGLALALSHALREAGVQPSEVRVPEDTLRVWLGRVGVNTRGRLVGWLYVSPANAMQDSSIARCRDRASDGPWLQESRLPLCTEVGAATRPGTATGIRPTRPS